MFKVSLGENLVAVLMIGLVTLAILVPSERNSEHNAERAAAPANRTLASDGGPFTAL
jgi:hypothetical protein